MSSRPTVGVRTIGNRTVRAAARPERQGIWTSAGFLPTGTGQVSRYDRARRHVGYGVVGYPAFGYPYGYGYLNGGLDLDDNDPNDPNLQTNAGTGGYGYDAENAPPPAPYGDAAGGDYGYAGPDGVPFYDPQDALPSRARPSYRPQASTSAAASDGMNHPQVTLIFKDGRQPLQIENYALTRNRIFVRDRGIDRDIPLADLDIPATKAANERAGVAFALPDAP